MLKSCQRIVALQALYKKQKTKNMLYNSINTTSAAAFSIYTTKAKGSLKFFIWHVRQDIQISNSKSQMLPG